MSSIRLSSPRLPGAPCQIASALRQALLASVAVVAAGLAACDHPRIPDALHTEVTDPAKRHPIVVTPQAESIDILLGDGGAGHDQGYIEATRFLRQYKRNKSGLLHVALPNHDGPASRFVRAVIEREGIPRERVTFAYTAPRRTITLTYDRIAAIGPVCGDWSSDVTRNPEHIPYADFGCSAQHNIAAMAANPTDTIFAAREVPRIGAERPGVPKQAAGGAGSGAGGAAPPAGGGGAGATPPAAAP